jgi:outer membrane protein assembly factor BamD
LPLACASSLFRGKPQGPQETYDVAVEDLEDGLYPEAIAGFTEVKTKYPYSALAALSDLRIADTHFARGKYLEAIDTYRVFLKYHPSHADAVYAMFRIGESYYEQTPSDWWFLPPAEEKDQASTRLAISAYRDFLARFPDTSQTDTGRAQLDECLATVKAHEENGDASDDLKKCQDVVRRHELIQNGKRRLDECHRKLADHEIYVARFYFDRDAFKSAIARAEGLLRDYPGLGLDEEALWIAARSHLKMTEPELARKALERLVNEFPESSNAGEAAQLLNNLGTAPASPADGEPRGD